MQTTNDALGVGGGSGLPTMVVIGENGERIGAFVASEVAGWQIPEGSTTYPRAEESWGPSGVKRVFSPS